MAKIFVTQFGIAPPRSREKGVSGMEFRVPMVLKDHLVLRELGHKLQNFQDIMIAIVRNKYWIAADVKTATFELLTADDASSIGKGFSLALISISAPQLRSTSGFTGIRPWRISTTITIGSGP